MPEYDAKAVWEEAETFRLRLAHLINGGCIARLPNVQGGGLAGLLWIMKEKCCPVCKVSWGHIPSPQTAPAKQTTFL